MKRTASFILLAAGASFAGASVAQDLAQQRVNPFSNPQAEVENAGDGHSHDGPFKLKAVMPSDQLALANIDGEILALGELYKGYTLTEVTEESVRLERGTGVVELFVSQTESESEDG